MTVESKSESAVRRRRRFKDLTGKRFGRLVALEEAGRSPGGDIKWRCLCDCGGEAVARGSSLSNGNTKSCGCISRERHLIHGHTSWSCGPSRTYRSWHAMRARCFDSNHRCFKHYGGRGITVCERWRDSFENFLADVGERPEGMTLDRTNNDGNYEPGNCRWATISEQNKNRRRLSKKTTCPPHMPMRIR